jgi:hypothetical protein
MRTCRVQICYLGNSIVSFSYMYRQNISHKFAKAITPFFFLSNFGFCYLIKQLKFTTKIQCDNVFARCLSQLHCIQEFSFFSDHFRKTKGHKRKYSFMSSLLFWFYSFIIFAKSILQKKKLFCRYTIVNHKKDTQQSTLKYYYMR